MFKIGQKVVCVEKDFGYTINDYYNISININEIYTVAHCSLKCDVSNLNFLTLVETGECWWREISFQPLDETFAEDILAMITEQIEEEELILTD